MQPVIYLNEDGERKIEMMRWAFKLPDRLLFNARSEGIERSKFWADAFLKARVIVPGDAIYEWQEVEKGKRKPKYELSFVAINRLAWLVSGSSGKTRRQVNGNEPLRFSPANRTN
jgi:putative SOS response-associated peptidase YedK